VPFEREYDDNPVRNKISGMQRSWQQEILHHSYNLGSAYLIAKAGN